MSSTIFNQLKEIRAAYSILKLAGIEQNGIIFGGMVRDEIIATHNKSLFDDHIKSDRDLYSKFWDESFHPETIKRTKVPNDMDIYFRDNNDAQKFIDQDIQNFIKMYNGKVSVRNVRNSRALFYSAGNSCTHKKITIVMRLGRTISFRGHRIQLNIDCLINNEVDYPYEPPFGASDFTCNLFVMVKNSSSQYDIRLSNNTGTPLDTLDFFSKKKLELKIIDEMLHGRVEFIRNIISRNAEYINGFRIMKMIMKREYNITNVLFRDIEKTEEIMKENEETSSTCDICMSEIDFKDDEALVEILTNKHHKNIMHKNCFIEYFQREITRRYVNTDTSEIECRCSRRNSFNFKDSYKHSFLYKREIE